MMYTESQKPEESTKRKREIMGPEIRREYIVMVFPFLFCIISIINCSLERVNMIWIKRSKDSCQDFILSFSLVEAGFSYFCHSVVSSSLDGPQGSRCSLVYIIHLTLLQEYWGYRCMPQCMVLYIGNSDPTQELRLLWLAFLTTEHSDLQRLNTISIRIQMFFYTHTKK